MGEECGSGGEEWWERQSRDEGYGVVVDCVKGSQP